MRSQKNADGIQLLNLYEKLKMQCPFTILTV